MFIDINRNSGISYKKQLYDAFTLKILNGELKEGEKLPSSRLLARQLNIARNTVTEIYDQMIAEAYLVTVKGKGTYVSNVLTSSIIISAKEKVTNTENKKSKTIIDFIAGTPDLKSFPKKAWLDACRENLYDNSQDILMYNDSFGYDPLRKEISEYLFRQKGIQCSCEQIMMTCGTKGALEIISLVFEEDRKTALLESPGINFAKDIFEIHGYDLNPLKMDHIGIKTDEFPEVHKGLIYTTPSHQFPLGGVLSIDRRQKLIEYARKKEHYIIEDDYDGEFRYSGAIVNSLYQLSNYQVIHVGTFSKTLAPALQLGYMVIPNHLLNRFEKMRNSIHHQPSNLAQLTVYRMISSGFYEKHVYKMCKIYKRKMKLLTDTMETVFGDSVSIYGSNVGMHIIACYSNVVFDDKTIEKMKDKGIIVETTDEYNLKPKGKSDSLILGFGHLTEEEIIKGVELLRKAILQS